MSEEPQKTESTSEVTVVPTQAHNGIAIAAMVIGIISLCVGFLPFVGFILGTIAIILGIISIKKKIGKGMAVAGIATGAVTVVWNIIVTITVMAGLSILGGAVTELGSQISDSVNDYDKSQQIKIDSKKDFTKGSIAVFGDFEVKVNSVQRNYVPEDSYYKADDGKELIVVNISAKNISKESNNFYSYSLDISENGVIKSFSSSSAPIEDEFDDGNVSAGATNTGNVVFEVSKDETNLKLQYEDSAWDSKTESFKDIVYTLAI